MKRPIRIVIPFRPFKAESDLHKSLPDFDWIEALRMLMHTAELHHGHCEVRAITDVDTDLPVKSLRYATTRRRLMLWTLEACLRYLESSDFDRNTVMLDVDQLVYGKLDAIFNRAADFGVLVRPSPKHLTSENGQPFLNGVQFWRAKSQAQLVAFYTRALAIAEGLPDDRIVWGADQDAVRALIEPIEEGIVMRSGLTVHMVNAETVIETFSTGHQIALAEGRRPSPTKDRPILDFRWTRKPFMPMVYRAAFLEGAVA